MPRTAQLCRFVFHPKVSAILVTLGICIQVPLADPAARLHVLEVGHIPGSLQPESVA